MKKCLILILTIIVILSLHSQDQTTDKNVKSLENQKAFEISTGLSLINSFNLSMEKKENDYFKDNSWIGYTVILSIPTSIIYYPCNYYGIGGSYQLGLGVFIIKGQTHPFPYNWMLINKIKIVNKFGNLNKKIWFLLETGINLNGLFSSRYFLPRFNDLNYFSFGPSIFIGYENIVGTNIELTVGFIFDGTYYHKDFMVLDSYENIRLVVAESYNWDLNFGIEFRFKFCYLKNIK